MRSTNNIDNFRTQNYRAPDSSTQCGNKISESALSPSKQQQPVQVSIKKFEAAGSNPVQIPAKPERAGPVAQSSWSQRYRVVESPGKNKPNPGLNIEQNYFFYAWVIFSSFFHLSIFPVFLLHTK